MVLENLKSTNENMIAISWKNLINFINSKNMTLDEINNFFDLNKNNIRNSLDILDISKISHIFCFISFHVRSYDHCENKKTHLYPTKFFIFEFFCNYLLDRAKKDHFLEENFIPIMQQAFLNKSNKYDEKNFRNLIINIIAKYFINNNILPFKVILPMIHKSSNKKNFLGLFDSVDPKKRIIPPAIIQEKIADYLFSFTKSLKYIPDIITDPDPESKKKEAEMTKQEQENISPNKRSLYEEYFNIIFKNLDYCHFSTINFSPQKISLDIYLAQGKLTQTPENISDYIRDPIWLASQHANSVFPEIKQKESTIIMKNIVNMAKEEVWELKELKLKPKKLLEDGNGANFATEISEISGPDFTPEIVNSQPNYK